MAGGFQRLPWARNKPGPGYKVNRSHPLAKGLVGVWPFNEKGGTQVIDYSGYGNHGTMSAMAHYKWSPSPTLFKAPCIKSIYTSGTTTPVINVPDAPSLRLAKTFTIAMWVYNITGGHCFISKRDPAVTGATVQYNYGLWQTAGNPLFLEFATADGVNHTSPSSYTVVLNKWFHYAIVRDETSPIITTAYYVNSVYQGGTTDSLITQNACTKPLQIGGYSNSGTYSVDGYLDVPCLWNRALNGSEVVQIYRDPFAFFNQRTISFGTIQVYVPPKNQLMMMGTGT